MVRKNYFSDSELHIEDAELQEKVNMMYLRDSLLNPVREALGKITCTSGHRNKEHNARVGGAKNSHHLCLNGYAAADLRPDKCTLEELFWYIRNNFEYAELILEYDQGIVHVSKNLDHKKNIKRSSMRKVVNSEKIYESA